MIDSRQTPRPTSHDRAEAGWTRNRLRSIPRNLRRHPVLAGTLLVGLAYAVADQGWRQSLEVMLVYSLGSCLLALFCQRASRAHWLFLLWNLTFVVDLGFKAFVRTIYQAAPDAPQVIEGLSNTNGSESTEFLLHYWMVLGSFALPLLAFLALLVFATRPVPWTMPRGRRGVVAVCLAFTLLHLHPTVRRANPIVFWTVQAATIEEFRANVETLDDKRAQARRDLARWAPAYAGPEQHTVGLVIGESTNRWNWQLYGYGRETTPALAGLEPELLVLRDVISAAPSTVSSLRYMLTPRTLDKPDGDERLPSVLMLARAAGYKVFWISNQHDLYITQRFAREADQVTMLNTGETGSSPDDTRSLDERVLPAWQAALDDPAPSKLIVAHLIGAHAHYDLRSPADMHLFEHRRDAVDQALAQRGRPDWVREKRAQYDDAMRYQDRVISDLLGRFRAAVADGSGAWLYTSDHGEEVGHTRDFTGHAPDEPGQVIPLLVWHPGCCSEAQKKQIESRPFQTDVLDWTLLDLLHIQTRIDSPTDRVLRDGYRPRERRLHDGTSYASESPDLSRPSALRRSAGIGAG